MEETEDDRLLEALRLGDEGAFRTLFERHNRSLLRLARGYAQSPALAEEIVQETWVAVVRGIARFEGRSALKTWIVGILFNVARTRASREARTIPFSSAAAAAEEEPGGGLDPDRFFAADHPRYAGHWRLGPAPWALPEERLLSGETRAVLLAAVDALPPAQREVIALRDIAGWTAGETCNALGISETNQRVLLHRARTKVRTAVEADLGAVAPTV
jgi:RNA polymerase sigma-70 factor (ECF subfamily)